VEVLEGLGVADGLGAGKLTHAEDVEKVDV
jgi:hypothetical protein